jgi:hypothetical protein
MIYFLRSLCNFFVHIAVKIYNYYTQIPLFKAQFV